MKWVDDEDYKKYIKCIGVRDYDAAAQHMKKVLGRAMRSGADPEEIGALIYDIGRVKQFGGKVLSAKQYFARADRVSGEAALVRLLIAKFYLEFTATPSLGVKWLRKCLEAGHNFQGRFDKRWKNEAQILLDKAVARQGVDG